MKQLESLASVKERVGVFKALADPTRYRMVLMLLEREELGCAELAEAFPLSLPALSHHYRVLENAGVILTRREGNHIFLRLDRSRLAWLLPSLKERRE